MAETATKTTTPRKRAATRTTTAKTTTSTPVAKPADDGRTKITFTLNHVEDTKSYAKFSLDTDVDGNKTGCVGTVYAPLGTEEVKVLFVGPAEAVSPEE